jgi:putative FmdB family regulatory protein
VPIYEYECTRCKHRFEKLQRFSDPPADECPACGGPVSQMLSAPAIQFKGSGWYVTDYARKSSSAAPLGNGKSGGGSAGEGSTSTTAKPDAKPDTKSVASSEQKK